MYVHVRAAKDLRELGTADPLALVPGGEVELVHSECVEGAMTVDDASAERIRLRCSKCDAEQELDRQEAREALRRVLEDDEYAWAGEAGFIPG